ncbi:MULTISPECIES: hypothetical protein [unclassified Sphingomonas]|uniref:hypothetical protein n=1 Tax=unclassified Sphingomonas TaxID=196159 RepID=UPI000E1047D3|nr:MULTISPECIES: hypothetical protein [unclassified Sphingomonas]AXJ97102.1 hypothetical protein DM480_13375 [Sphingomonas sp. FARSPH]
MVEFGRHLGELPWGWWLRAGSAGFEDPEGRTWRSVRDAFWEGELKLPSADEALDQHELMLRVMTSIREGMSARESMHDIFEGDMMFSRFYRCWLANIGMIEPSHGRATLEAPLSALGRSVLMMLQATREPEFEGLPMRAVVAAVTAAKGADAEARERALLTFEREVGFRRHVFARERVGTRHLVTLTGITAGARMPTRYVAWSHSFADATPRDDLFIWLAERVHRWDEWGELAHRKGAHALTSHLLSLIVGAGGLST